MAAEYQAKDWPGVFVLVVWTLLCQHKVLCKLQPTMQSRSLLCSKAGGIASSCMHICNTVTAVTARQHHDRLEADSQTYLMLNHIKAYTVCR